ncbi:hypothetical protein N7478_005117 [Penicillium angulare]|uniref:uncharacterized protein n=1 Tax=Penicillium angulare TaxID=116970 RepID=UPI0025424C2E|nr:uncharacterized protein N7478_005117 [Penicillium angulare]KAJ5279745.1 hypothetical protein N7478_005117 [Penicillium angulare]
MAPLTAHKITKFDTTRVDHSTQLDTAEKRRLQNRINQRASRERKALKSGKIAFNQQKRWIIYTEGAERFAEPGPCKDQQPESLKAITPSGARCYNDEKDAHNFNVVETWNFRCNHLITQLEMRIASAKSGLDYTQLLAPVTNLNIVKALLNNASILGLSFHALEEDIASHFNISGPIESDLQLPTSLQPSSCQREIIHHPWIDLMPVRSFRDALLRNLDKYDEDELCSDMHGGIGASDALGLIVWGESWDPAAYEVSEAIFKKWTWIFRECPEVVTTTNYWRKRRGEKPLRFQQPGGFIEKDEL